jgi:hypothetical protein
MSNERFKRLLGAASITLAVAAAGCGGSSTPSSSTASSATSPSSTTSSTTGSGTSTTAGGTTTSAAGLTPPGAKLAVGQTATVPFQSPNVVSNAAPPYKVQVTVASITKASFADFKGIQLDASEKAGTPYYVKFKITNVGNGDLGTNAEGAISGIDNTGQDATSVTFIGSFPPCDDTTPPKPFTHGKTWSTCQVYLVPGGITGADYSGFVQTYIESPVTWK